MAQAALRALPEEGIWPVLLPTFGLSFSLSFTSMLSGILPKVRSSPPSYFDITRRNMHKNKNSYFFLHISSSYAKILGKTNFQPREIPRSRSKAKNGKERERKKDRKLVITIARYALQNHLSYQNTNILLITYKNLL